MPTRLALLVALALLLPFASGAPAAGAIYAVNLTSDAAEALPGDGVCDVDLVSPGEQCSLRAAIQTANELPDLDFVELDSAVYVLSIPGAGEDAAATGDLDVTSPIEISGDFDMDGNHQTFIDGKRAKDRSFDVHPAGSLTLRRATLQNGKTAKDDFDPGFPGEVSGGGCIRSAGTLALDSVFLYRCVSSDDGGCVSVIGGSASLTSSILASCRAKNEGGGIEITAAASALLSRVTAAGCRAGAGGAIATRSTTTTLLNLTVDGNKAKLGGGIAVLGAGAATLSSSTLSSNSKVNLDASGSSGTVTVSNSIVWGAATDCLGALVSAGGNLEGSAACGLTNTGANDQQNQDPLLQPLNEFEAGVLTRPLSPNSPAIDHGLDAGAPCETQDAREKFRVDVPDVGLPGVECDAGSFEFDGTDVPGP